MRNIYRYATSTWSGVERYSCLDCAFDVLKNETAMMDHCKRFGHGRDTYFGMTDAEWEATQTDGPKGNNILLAELCWNTRDASAEAALALVQESRRLHSLGNMGSVIITDNGSQDGTMEAIERTLFSSEHPPNPARTDIIKNPSNLGISRARNQIIDFMLNSYRDFGYILFTDGDIEVVPYSSYVMLKYLECHPTLGVIGAYSSDYTTERVKAVGRFLEIQESRVRDDIKVAWTQYGLFRSDMFRQGLRFDEEGPFGEPGWGFEDDDFYFQMREKGWGNKYFGGMTYLHRNIRSSWPNMEADGLNPVAIFHKRKEYLVQKWRKRGLDPAILRAVEAQQPPRRPQHAK